MVPITTIHTHEGDREDVVNPCIGFACPYHYYRGPYGRHIGILIHLGHVTFLLGVTLVTLGYTAFKNLPEITVQRVIGLISLQLGFSFMLGGFTTYTRAQYTKVGGVSPLWSKDILIALYTRTGFLQVFLAFAISMVGFNLQELWALPFKISGPVGLLAGLVMLIAPRIYSRTPCYKENNIRPVGWMGQHCACRQGPSTISSVVQESATHQGQSSFRQPVVVFSTSGNDIPHAFVHHSVALPPSYESLSPRGDSPPSYVLVSPVSPPPTYDEAIGTPKEEDPQAGEQSRPRQGYLPSYDAAIANPLPSAYPDQPFFP